MTIMQKNTKVFATKLSLQTEKSTVIIILQDNNKNNKSNKIIINQPVPREMSKYFCSKAVLSRDDFIICNLKMYCFLLKVLKNH